VQLCAIWVLAYFGCMLSTAIDTGSLTKMPREAYAIITGFLTSVE
jgi:hypothetical protein